MTPKEKAGWLNERFYFSLPNNGSFTGPNNINDRWKEAKQCALIAVDEIIKSRDEDKGFNDTLYSTSEYHNPHPMYLTYWQQVKQEIEKL